MMCPLKYNGVLGNLRLHFDNIKMLSPDMVSEHLKKWAQCEGNDCEWYIAGDMEIPRAGRCAKREGFNSSF